jgi:hypothetical protein
MCLRGDRSIDLDDAEPAEIATAHLVFGIFSSCSTNRPLDQPPTDSLGSEPLCPFPAGNSGVQQAAPTCLDKKLAGNAVNPSSAALDAPGVHLDDIGLASATDNEVLTEPAKDQPVKLIARSTALYMVTPPPDGPFGNPQNTVLSRRLGSRLEKYETALGTVPKPLFVLRKLAVGHVCTVRAGTSVTFSM